MRSSGSFSPLANVKSLMVKSPATGSTPAIGCSAGAVAGAVAGAFGAAGVVGAAAGDAGDRTTVQVRDPLVGTVLAQRFRIDFQIAAGGFGAIYQATDLASRTEVALKVLHAKLARDPNVIERFRREAATLSNLRDPH